ncbi:DUF4184 family protein [Nocardia heshunensis]
MPFTLAHPAAVLPLRRTLWFPGLVAGSIAPDVPYYVPVWVDGEFTHSLLGLPADMLLGAILLAIAWALRRSVSGMLGKTITMTRPTVLGAAAALLIGAVTHLAWDAFTHTDGAVVQNWEPMRESVIGPHRVYNVIGYISSIGGMLLLACYLVAWYRRAATIAPDPRRIPVLLSLLAVAVLAGLIARTDPVAKISLYDCVRHTLIYAITSAGTGFVLYALVSGAASASRGNR